MRSQPRRHALRTRDGIVRKKNNWKPDRDDYFAWRRSEIRLTRERPGPGYRHVLTVAHVQTFIELLPDWDEAAVGLRAIVLAPGQGDAMGWYDTGVVALCAWDSESGLWTEADYSWIEHNRSILDLLDVEIGRQGGTHWLRWTEAQARAFMLLDVLPHELGHHHDLMTTRTRRIGRGEPYAYEYARRTLEKVWPLYGQHFEL